MIDKNVNIGTIGHVNHGQTSLTKALQYCLSLNERDNIETIGCDSCGVKGGIGCSNLCDSCGEQENCHKQ